MLDLESTGPDLGDLAPQRNPAALTWKGCAYLSPRCSICAHSQENTLSQMLTGHLLRQDGQRYTMGDVVAWARLSGAPVSKAALSRHLSGHVRGTPRPQETPQEVTGGRVSRHIKRAAEALVHAVFEQVRAEFAEAITDAVRDAKQTPESRAASHPAERLDVEQPGEGQTPVTVPRAATGKPRKTTVKGDRHRSMPRTFQSALKLEAALNRIQAMPHAMRPTLLRELAAEHGKDTRTARRWLSAYEQHGLAGIMQTKRHDSGAVRVPLATVRALQEFVEAHPHLSTRKLYRLLKTQQHELLEYEGKQGNTRLVSITTLAKLARQMRHPVGEPEEG